MGDSHYNSWILCLFVHSELLCFKCEWHLTLQRSLVASVECSMGLACHLGVLSRNCTNRTIPLVPNTPLFPIEEVIVFPQEELDVKCVIGFNLLVEPAFQLVPIMSSSTKLNSSLLLPPSAGVLGRETRPQKTVRN